MLSTMAVGFVDGSDNFPTRYLVNDACVLLNKPLVFGSIYKFEGQVSVFNYQNGTTYRCLYPTPPGEGEVPNCAEVGVLGVLPGIIGSLQAVEAIKIITRLGEVLSGKILLYDALRASFQTFRFAARADSRNFTSLQNDYGTTCAIHRRPRTRRVRTFYHWRHQLAAKNTNPTNF